MCLFSQGYSVQHIDFGSPLLYELLSLLYSYYRPYRNVETMRHYLYPLASSNVYGMRHGCFAYDDVMCALFRPITSDVNIMSRISWKGDNL